MDISSKLKCYRKQNNYTQEYVANQLNISRQAISAWENNLTFPDVENLLLLSQLYGVSLDDLLGNTKEIEDKEKRIVISDHLFEERINSFEMNLSELEEILIIFLTIESFRIPLLGLVMPIFIIKKIKEITCYKKFIVLICIISVFHCLYYFIGTVL